MTKRITSLISIAIFSVLLIFTIFNLSTSGTTLHYIKAPYTKTEWHGEYSKIEIQNHLSDYDNEKDTVIFLSTIGDSRSYGKDKTVADLLETIKSFKFDVNQISIGFLLGDVDEFKTVVNYFENYFKRLNYQNKHEYINRITILSAPFIDDSFKSINRQDRQLDKYQRIRRRNIARSRNFVVNNSLNFEKYTLFIDADIIKINHNDMLLRFINSNKDIAVPRITRGDNNDYDKNSWAGQRTVPTDEQLKIMDKNDWDHWDYTPFDIKDKITHLGAFVNKNKDKPKNDVVKQLEYALELDSVGGAILFAKSIIYHQGIQFPPNYIIGTTWERLEGYDGIETEGLCYIAKSSGYKCWGYPNLVAEHSLE